eukprot:3588154-Rhodomonas_salina.1
MRSEDRRKYAIRLRVSHAMSGTNIAHGAFSLRACYVMSGADSYYERGGASDPTEVPFPICAICYFPLYMQHAAIYLVLTHTFPLRCPVFPHAMSVLKRYAFPIRCPVLT